VSNGLDSLPASVGILSEIALDKFNALRRIALSVGKFFQNCFCFHPSHIRTREIPRPQC
jgi:hypothetical protein